MSASRPHRRRIPRRLAALLATAGLALSCGGASTGADAGGPEAQRGRSPFSVHPSEFALEAPCRRMGTFHKESRGRIEQMRACGRLSRDEWACMARSLQSLDREFTATCRTREVGAQEILEEQRLRYTGCLGGDRAPDVECALLSTDLRCLASACE